MVLFGSLDRALHAIKAKSGILLWKFHTKKYVVASPAVAKIKGRPVAFFNSLDNYLYGVDILTGNQVMKFASGAMLWPYETRGGSIWSSPAIFGQNENATILYPAHDGKLYAFKGNKSDLVTTGDKNNEPVSSELSKSEQPRNLFSSWVIPLFSAMMVMFAFGITIFGNLAKKRELGHISEY